VGTACRVTAEDENERSVSVLEATCLEEDLAITESIVSVGRVKVCAPSGQSGNAPIAEPIT
jgi:hypothetical protein